MFITGNYPEARDPTYKSTDFVQTTSWLVSTAKQDFHEEGTPTLMCVYGYLSDQDMYVVELPDKFIELQGSDKAKIIMGVRADELNSQLAERLWLPISMVQFTTITRTHDRMSKVTEAIQMRAQFISDWMNIQIRGFSWVKNANSEHWMLTPDSEPQNSRQALGVYLAEEDKFRCWYIEDIQGGVFQWKDTPFEEILECRANIIAACRHHDPQSKRWPQEEEE